MIFKTRAVVSTSQAVMYVKNGKIDIMYAF